MQLEFHQVDAFTQRPFGGNPAVVYRLDAWLDDQLMQRIAAEHNLSETAFLVKEGNVWHIRWFTPRAEVPLCGHATLASAHVLFELYQEPGDRLEFMSKSGELRVTREEEGRLALDFPAQVPQEVGVTLELEHALGVAPVDALGANFLLAVLESEQQVRECAPDFKALAKLPWAGVIVTSPGMKHDFVSRFFAPNIGIDEDPVTGAAHCTLIPYWANRLGKRVLRAEQCSARSGDLWCRLDGDRVSIAGHSVLVASGRLWV